MLGRFAAQFGDDQRAVRDEAAQRLGAALRHGRAELHRHAQERARRCGDLSSIDEGRIGDAYLAGDIDIEGDMLRPFELRDSMKDFHLLIAAWRFIQPLLFGQVHTNRQAITAHYDIDPGVLPELPRSEDALLHARRL